MGVVTRKITPPDANGLVRHRLFSTLGRTSRFALIIGPAGAGKSTLLAQYAAQIPYPVAWYRADPDDRTEASLLEHLLASSQRASVSSAGPWSDVAAAARDLEAVQRGPCLLIIDDLQSLRGSEAEAALGRFLTYLPPHLRLLAASRSEPGSAINLPKLRVSGDVVEIGPDELRFRSWEVERLFRSVYGEPLPPEDIATLTRRTQGWAAGLQLFHLATAGKPMSRRRQVVRSLMSRPDLATDYLTANVLAELASDLREFLLDTCVLTALNGPLCDRLRGTEGSGSLLAELAHRRLLTTHLGENGWYRYHDVLRVHLQWLLVDRFGASEASRRNTSAGQLLEEAGRFGDAVVAFAYAQDFQAVSRVLSRGGNQLTNADQAWLDALPPDMPDDDPWLQLAFARQAVMAGRINAALASYRRGEELRSAGVAEIAGRERRALASWLDPRSRAAIGWIQELQAAARGLPEPARTAGLLGSHRRLVEATRALLSGNMRRASVAFRDLADDADTRPALAAAAELGAGVSAALAGHDDAAARLEQAADHSDRSGIAWLAHLARASLGLVDVAAHDDAVAAMERSRRFGDPLGTGLAALLAGLGRSATDAEEAVAHLSEAIDVFRELGLRPLEGWALAGRAIARSRRSQVTSHATTTDLPHDAVDMDASAAEDIARSFDATGLLVLASLARSSDDDPAVNEAIARLRSETGLRWRPPGDVDSVRADADRRPRLKQPMVPTNAQASDDEPGRAASHVSPARIHLRTLGGFRLVVNGEALDVSELKPRSRQVLYLLAANVGTSVHREVIVDSLWPESGVRSAIRALHVSLSSVRRMLSDASHTDGLHIARDGVAYRLVLGKDATSDIEELERRSAAGRASARQGRLPAARTHLTAALEAYEGDLLPEIGPADWIVKQRDHLRVAAVDTAELLADVCVGAGDWVGAESACTRGLELDRYRDALWRIAIRCREERGDQAAAARTRRLYAAVINELDLED